MFLHDITETVFASSSSTTYHHHGVLFNGNMLVCNDSNISACVKECARQYAPIDQQACVTAVEAKFAPYSNCFTGGSTVIVRGSKSRVRLRDLQMGDWVLDSGMKFSLVVGWLHRDLEATASFINLFHENGSICCTADHLIYCCDAADYVPATKAKTLEILYLDGSMTKSRVVKIAERTRTGIYAPLTASGTLLVNGVNASCYASPTALPFSVTQPVGQIALWPFRLGINSNNFLDVYCRTLYSLLAY